MLQATHYNTAEWMVHLDEMRRVNYEDAQSLFQESLSEKTV